MTTVNIGNNTGNTGGCTDVGIKQSSPTTNLDGTSFEIHKYGAGDHANALIKFDLSSITGPVTVSSATLNLYQTSNGGNYAVAARRLLRNWSETQATWNVYTTGNSWTTAGALSDSNDRNSTSTVGSAWDLTDGVYKTLTGLASEVQDWINGVNSNFGWVLERNDAGDDTTFKTFAAHTGTDGQRPYLTIVYAPATNDAALSGSALTGGSGTVPPVISIGL